MTEIDLKQYLYDILTIENQIYTFHNIEKIYLKKIEKIEEDRNTVFLNDKEDYKKRKFHRTNQVVPAPDVKPNCIGQKKSHHGRSIFIYGFNGINDMYRQVPERWLEGELSDLIRIEHDKYRRKHLVTWGTGCAFGILLSLLLHNLIPFAIAVIGSLILSYKIGDENKKQYIPGDEVYDTFMQIYTHKYNADLKHKKALFTPQLQHLTKEYEKYVKKHMDTLQPLLKQLYSKNLVHPKYQNFIAIAQLYDYVNIGRCTELSGSNGAYNMYETEKNNDLLMTNLDISLFKIEKYESSMYTLVNLLKQSDTITSKIFTEINHNTNTTLIQTNKYYKKQYLDICQRYQL